MTQSPAEVGRNKFDEWCWRRDLELKPVAAALGCSIETVRKLRLPFTDLNRRVPKTELAQRIFDFTQGEVTPADFYPPHLVRAVSGDAVDLTAEER